MRFDPLISPNEFLNTPRCAAWSYSDYSVSTINRAFVRISLTRIFSALRSRAFPFVFAHTLARLASRQAQRLFFRPLFSGLRRRLTKGAAQETQRHGP
jgi:hypothetical protein